MGGLVVEGLTKYTGVFAIKSSADVEQVRDDPVSKCLGKK